MVVHTASRHDAQLEIAREIDQRARQRQIAAHTIALDLDVEPVSAEY